MEGNKKEIMLKIDGIDVYAIEGTSILDVAKTAGIKIPTLCYNPAIRALLACRICSVEIIDKRGKKRIVPSCIYPVFEGLVVDTKSENVVRKRQELIKSLFARCPNAKAIQELAREYDVEKPSLLVGNPEEDCIRCGLCVRVCKEKVGVSAIESADKSMEQDVNAAYLTISDDCVGCGACAAICPTNSKNVRMNPYLMLEKDIKEAEDQFLNGTRDELLGVYTEIFAAKSSIDGQDGGMVTALLLSGMKKGLFDAVIVVKRTEGYKAEAIVAETADEILNARGTKYSRVKTTSKVEKLIEKGKRKIAIVGTPCEVRKARKMQQRLLSTYPDLEITIVGLFCFEAFDYEKLKEETKRLLGVDLDKAKKTQIQKGKFIVTVDGKEYSAKVKEFHHATQGGCAYCNDFVGRLSDVSVGAVGSAEGYSTVIVRSEKGKKLLENVDFVKGDVDKEAIIKLASFKKRRAENNFAPIIEGRSTELK